MLARISIVTGQARSPELEQSVARPERLRASALADERIGNLIEMLTVLALARQVRGELDQANAALRDALNLAAPEGYIRVFLDEGPSLVALLEDAARATVSHDSASSAQYAGALLRILTTGAKAPVTVQAPAEPFGARELEVLRLMADGASNADIAHQLVIGSATAKNARQPDLSQTRGRQPHAGDRARSRARPAPAVRSISRAQFQS